MDQEKDVVIFLGLIWRRVYLGKKLLIEDLGQVYVASELSSLILQ